MKSADAVASPITTRVLVLVEGEDEAYLVQKMCEHWFAAQASAIGFENVGGRDNFPKRFKDLTVRSLGPLQIVGVIADSEDDAAATHQRWVDLFKEVSPQLGRDTPCEKLQLPGEAVAGAFESLVLQALGHDPVADCAKAFRDCVAPYTTTRTQAQKDKIAVQAWLSALLGKAYGNVFKAQKVNEAQPLLDYDHPAFAPIKTFLQGLLNLADSQPKPT